MPSAYRTLTAAAFALVFSAAMADRAYITVSAFPTISVADGRSTATISAEVRDASGRLVPDGTRVLLTTTLGRFRENIATTVGGIARATLQADGLPGTAKITATSIGLDAPPTVFEFEFVGDRSLLNSAREYVEIYAPTTLQFTADTRIIGVAGLDRGVSVRYHDIDVSADDVQLNVRTMELRARRAKLKFGRSTRDYEELYLRLGQRRGYGITTFRTKRPNAIALQGKWPIFLKVDEDGQAAEAVEEERYGVVELRAGSVRPANVPVGANIFRFEDLSESPSTIVAKKAVVFPRKEIQFQRAEVLVGGARVMKMPLYQLSLTGTQSALLTDSFVNVDDNQLSINYPYFLTLKPGQTSLLRFRTGGRTGRSMGTARGAYLDYELNWNRGDEMQGGLTVSGLARNDWMASLRQYWRLDDATSVSGQLDMPAGQSIFGSANASRQFDGFQVSLNANANRTLRGFRMAREDYSFVAEKDPTKVGRLPIRLFYGVTANSSRTRSEFYNRDQQTYGLRLRGQTLPLNLDGRTTLSSSFSLSRLIGTTLDNGVAVAATVALSRRITNQASMVATYDFTRDGFNDAIQGQHRLSLQGYFDAGRTNLSLFAARSLDIDRLSLYGDLSYRLSPTWRLGYGYTYDRYLADSYFDTNLTVGYRIGWREIGLIWSRQSNRIGVQFLGASF